MKFSARATCGSRWYRDSAGNLHLNTPHAFGRGDKRVFLVPLDQEAVDATPGWPGSRPSRLTPADRRKAKKLAGKARRLAVEALWAAAIIHSEGREGGWDGHTWTREVCV